MPVYQYRGYKADGASATGIVDAESPKVARLKLRKDGVFPTEMAEQEGATKTVIAHSSSGLIPGVARSPVLTVTDVALMTRQLATLLVAGLPLVDALGVLMDQTEKKAIKGLLADVREAIPLGPVQRLVRISPRGYEADRHRVESRRRKASQRRRRRAIRLDVDRPRACLGAYQPYRVLKQTTREERLALAGAPE